MKKITIKYLSIITLAFSLVSLININTAEAAAPIQKPAQTSKTTAAMVNIVSPSMVVNNPGKYLNKTITFNATFIAYTSLGLDYKPAYRDPNKYIGILIARDDVTDHVVPLSEMKIFISREEAEKHVDLDQGDKIKLSGTVFSTALGDPWLDIKSFTVLTQKNNKKDK